jgi:alkylation response protein AidB-like acyl-CoA dehydrogenase
VDAQGPVLEDNRVSFNPATQRALDLFAQADLMGFSAPRKYGGLHFPAVTLCMASEIIARADGSFLNFGLQQDIALALVKFGSPEQIAACLPPLCRGEWDAAMVLTEPEAGSDLQAVNLRAFQDQNGQWRLNGVKRFITNGCGRLALILARSEPAARGARGLSFFLYRRDESMTIRRLEHKMGIHGSATCELEFNDAPVELVGERQRGLTKYTLWLMNCARLGVAAQAVGIAEAAYREAFDYAGQRIQFDAPIKQIPAVYEMLTRIKVHLEAGRSLLYETARFMDLKEALEEYQEKHPEQKAELIEDKKKYGKLAGFFTPLVKAYATEMANQAASDALQIHGGSGYMREFAVERLYRDARVTNLYEGTTQMQIVAALSGVISGTADMILGEYDAGDHSHAPDLVQKLRGLLPLYREAVDFAKARGDEQKFLSLHARALVEMCTDLILAYLLLRDARHSRRKLKTAADFIALLVPRLKSRAEYILHEGQTLLDNYAEVLEGSAGKGTGGT